MTINQDVLNAVLRHVYTATGVGTTVLIAVGISQGDATAIGEAVHKIGDGLASIIAGISMLAPIISALYAGWTATRKSQVKSVAAIPGTLVRVPDQSLADSLPSNVTGPRESPT